MRAPKLGGRERLRIFVCGNDDLVEALLPAGDDGQGVARGLRTLVREKYRWAFDVELRHEPCGRSELLLQQLDGLAPSDGLDAELAAAGGSFVAPLRSGLFEGPVDVVAFSVQPEIAHTLWAHRASGYLVSPPPNWQDAWGPAARAWFRERFAPMGLGDSGQFTERFRRLIRAVKERLDAHVIVFNGSSIDPGDRVHNYHDRDDTVSLRTHRFNLAVLGLSAAEGISVIDVDRLTGELGADDHVRAPFRYSVEACQVICGEFLRVLEDIGFFENRPLVMQVGGSGN